MNTAGQVYFPLDLLGIFGAGEHLEELATAGTLLLVFGKIVNHILRREIVPTFSAIEQCPFLCSDRPPWRPWNYSANKRPQWLTIATQKCHRACARCSVSNETC
jgi:hypothetical protein